MAAHENHRPNEHDVQAHSLSPALRETFWRRMLVFESGPFTTPLDRLLADGVDVPDPDSLTEAQVTPKLWEILGRLAGMGMFFSQTDHLSDRELYTHLWHESLHEEIPVEDDDENDARHFDLLGTGSEEHLRLYLKFYADEQTRARWQQDFPDVDLPPHEEPPYDRDSRLPRPTTVRGVEGFPSGAPW